MLKYYAPEVRWESHGLWDEVTYDSGAGLLGRNDVISQDCNDPVSGMPELAALSLGSCPRFEPVPNDSSDFHNNKQMTRVP